MVTPTNAKSMIAVIVYANPQIQPLSEDVSSSDSAKDPADLEKVSPRAGFSVLSPEDSVSFIAAVQAVDSSLVSMPEQASTIFSAARQASFWSAVFWRAKRSPPKKPTLAPKAPNISWDGETSFRPSKCFRHNSETNPVKAWTY